VSLYGLERARELAVESHRQALELLAAAGGDTESLHRIADFIFTRTS
jgi:hypothetical protein